MASVSNVQTVGDRPRRKARAEPEAPSREKRMRDQNGQQNAGVPSWLWPVVINLLVFVASVGTTWGVMKSDISNVDVRLNSLVSTVNSQISRIDDMVKAQDRITRLEERLGNITSLLVEIKTDLKEGRYAVRRDGVITPSTAR